ncbi:hypothetical protein [Neisseria chenwenguii]|uniref:hypothetical protein n=1 Tax=Neisseria chenwenguii TaxID=1853278 RepID=UPI0012FE5679|nr:hypothetical protein [Neisseria chenwenguii]
METKVKRYACGYGFGKRKTRNFLQFSVVADFAKCRLLRIREKSAGKIVSNTPLQKQSRLKSPIPCRQYPKADKSFKLALPSRLSDGLCTAAFSNPTACRKNSALEAETLHHSALYAV